MNLVWQPTSSTTAPRRLRPLLHAAAVRADRQRDGAEVRRADPRQSRHHHHGRAGGHRRHDAVRRARQLLRRRRLAEVRRRFTATVDGYYKISKHLIDEGQFGAPIILTPFNYAGRPPVRRRADRLLRQGAVHAPTPTSPIRWRRARTGSPASSTSTSRRSTTSPTTTSTSTTTSATRSPPAASYLLAGHALRRRPDLRQRPARRPPLITRSTRRTVR